MKRKDLAKELARTKQMQPAPARDLVDEVVDEILRKLRAGEPMDIHEMEKHAKAGTLLAHLAGGK